MSSFLYNRDLRNPKYMHPDTILRTNEALKIVHHNRVPSNKSQLNIKENPSHNSSNNAYTAAFYAERDSLKDNLIDPNEIIKKSLPLNIPKKIELPISSLYTTPQNSKRPKGNILPPDISIRNIRIVSKRNDRSIDTYDSYYALKPKKDISKSRLRDDSINSTQNISQLGEHQKFMTYLTYLRQESDSLSKGEFQKRLASKMVRKSTDTLHLNHDAHNDSGLQLPPILKRYDSRIMANSRAYQSDYIHITNDDDIIENRPSNQKSDSHIPEDRTFYHEGRNSQKLKSISNSKSHSRIPTIMDTTPTPSIRFRSKSRHQKDSEADREKESELEWYNNHKDLFVKIAELLQSLFNLVSHDKKVVNSVEELCHRNKKIVEIMTTKGHQIHDYDAQKLIRRFSKIEVAKEIISPLERSEKIKHGLIVIDSNLVQLLYLFSEKLDELVLVKKRENLKHLEEKLIDGENKLIRFREKKIGRYHKVKSVKDLREAERIFKEKPKIDPYYFFQSDPAAMIEHYHYDELRYIKKKNIDDSRSIGQVFSNWHNYVQEHNIDDN